MIYTLPDVKREIKSFYQVKNIVVWIEEFGEGFDTHVGVYYYDKSFVNESEFYQIGEEESLSRAKNRAKRVEESLVRNGYKVENNELISL